MTKTKYEMTGYPSIDKPWLNYYKSELVSNDIPSNSAFQLMYQNNKDHLNETALIYFNRKISFGTLFDKIRKAASAFTTLGIKKGDIVTIQALNMPQMVIVFYALSYIGAIANIVFITANAKELHESIQNTESKMLVILENLWEKQKSSIEDTYIKDVLLLKIGEEADSVTKSVLLFKSKKRPKECLNWDSFLAMGNSNPEEVNESELPVVMVYTGGTTGKSKAVVLANRSMNALVRQYELTYVSLKRGTTFMNSLPPFIAFGIVCSMHVPLCLGVIDILVFDPKPTSASKYFVKYKPNFFVNGRLAIENIIDNKRVQKMDLSFLQVLAAGGEEMPTNFEEKVNAFLVSHNSPTLLSVGYGMSEVAATVVTGSPYVNKVGTVGIPLPETNIKIVTPDTTDELSYDEDGEICISAPTMMLEYYKNQAETDAIIKMHEDGILWVHSGDIGHISADGFLTISGRIKRIISIRENGIYHKVFPKLIEEVLVQIDYVETITIVSRKKEIIENELIAFVVKKPESDEQQILSEIRKKAEKDLETWERPNEYIFIDAIPRTTIGKVNYKKLERLLVEEQTN